MKPSVLRIGNLVDLGNRIAYMLEIGYSSCTVVDLEQTQDTMEEYSRLTPIPLTEEWLVKLGFYKDDVFADFCLKISNNRILGYDLINKTIHLGQFTSFDFRDCYIGKFEYVHELQNLHFDLTKEELEFKINTI